MVIYRNRTVKQMSVDFCIKGAVQGQHLVAKSFGGLLRNPPAFIFLNCQLQKIKFTSRSSFQQLLGKDNEDFTRFLLHTEVRWLADDNCLRSFVTLWGSIVLFLSDKQLGEQIISTKCDMLCIRHF